MVGDGSERTNAEHRARCLGIFEQCSFVGKQPRIVDYLSASDVLLLPSEQESFGLAALEAMAYSSAELLDAMVAWIDGRAG